MATKTTNPTKSSTSLLRNPFPGLRPFSIDESHLFFGREGQSDEVLLKLARNRFVGVIGPSGSGKSSFIYCGILPILYGGFLAHKGADWNVIVMRPGGGPIENLADAILKDDPNFIVADEEERTIRKTITTTLLRSSSLGMVEALKQSNRNKNKNYLLLVDQFEELFRFQKADINSNESVNEALAFVNLLTETVLQQEASIYVAITMRSDFIGDCAQFPDLTSLINDSHYLIPQMTREQKRAAIVGPVAVGNGHIAPRLVQQLLNDLGDKTDQLPILQHALMRTWDYWIKTNESGEPMDLLHYEAIGAMTEALSQHANEAYDELNDEQKRICECIFKSLTLKRSDADGIRRPTRVSELAAIADTSIDEIITIIEKFREPGRSLLTPPPNIQLGPHSVIDISHESLMRIWVRLKNWVEDEGDSVQIYLRLAEAAAMYQVGKGGLWRQPDLQMALNWQQKQKPTLVWGQRYDLAYERTMVFLEYSKQEYETEQRAKELEQKRALRRTRIIAITLGTATVICIGFMMFAIIQMTNAQRSKEIADAEAKRAIEQSEIADTEKRNAEVAAADARRQEEAANVAKADAENSAIAANEAKERAQLSEAQARSEKEAADKARRDAEAARANADQANIYAQNEAVRANQEAERALKLRMLSIAQSMSVKSIQEQEDKQLKGLLAVQSFQFNQQFDGNPYNGDIYNALYYSLKAIKGDSLHRLYGHTDAVRSIVFSKDGQSMYTAGSDGQIFRWNLNKTTAPELIAVNKYANKVLGISPDNKWLVCAGENANIQLFDLSNKAAKPRLIIAHTGEITDLVFLPNGNGFITTATDRKVVYHDLNSFKEIASLNSIARSISIHPEGKVLVLGQDNGKLIQINLQTSGYEITDIFTDPVAIWAVNFSPDAMKIAIGDQRGAVRIINTEKNQVESLFTGHNGRVTQLAFTNDNKMLASASLDASARLIVLSQPDEQPIVLRDHPSWVMSLAFDQSSKNLYTAAKDNSGSGNHSFRYWPLSMQSLSKELCGSLERSMTEIEWSQFVGADIEASGTCNEPIKTGSTR